MRKLAAAFIAFTLILTAYCAAWTYLHKAMSAEIERIYAVGPSKGIIFLGAKPVVTGFPGTPKVFYAGGFRQGEALVTFPEFYLTGFPIPGLPMTAEFPQGLAIAGYVNQDVWAVDELSATFLVPASLPADNYEETLREWREENEDITIKDLYIARDDLTITGRGVVGLDENLQASLALETNLEGYESFVQGLVAAQVVKPIPGMAAIAALNSMSERSEESGMTRARLVINLENQMLSLGPLQVARLPEIRWGTRNPPAPRQ